MTGENNRLVTVFGGSGFIGRHIVQRLAKRGWRVRVAVRRPEIANHLLPLGTVGQIQPIQANIRYRESIEQAVDGVDVVINLVGILSERGKQTFSAVQDAGALKVASASAEAGVAKFIQMSAIGANQSSASLYARTKYAGERAAFEHFPEATVIRPSIVFGPEDSFFNKFGEMIRLSLFLPLIGGGNTKFQPVFVGDVGEAVSKCAESHEMSGKILELGGSEIKTFRECLELLLEVTQRKRIFINIPFTAAKALGQLLRFAPGSPLTADQVELLKTDNVVSEEAKIEGRTLEGIGIAPKTLDTILPTYLWRFRPHGQFEQSNFE